MTTRHRTKGWSLAKGPVGLIGLALLAYGITALIFGGHGFAQHAPTGAVYGKTWLGLEVNGWTGLLFTAAGLLLLFGAPMHWGAKTMSLIVGTSLVALCVIALANGHGALGIFAANGLTELVWGAAGGLLIILSMLPRVGAQAPGAASTQRPRRTTRVASSAGSSASHERAREPVAPVSDTSDDRYAHRSVTTTPLHNPRSNLHG